MASEATVNADGSTSTTFDDTTNTDTDTPDYDAESGSTFDDATFEEGTAPGAGAGADDAHLVVKGTDPAIYLALAFIAVVVFYFLYYRRNKRKQMEREAFFYEMDGDKVRTLHKSTQIKSTQHNTTQHKLADG